MILAWDKVYTKIKTLGVDYFIGKQIDYFCFLDGKTVEAGVITEIKYNEEEIKDTINLKYLTEKGEIKTQNFYREYTCSSAHGCKIT